MNRVYQLTIFSNILHRYEQSSINDEPDDFDDIRNQIYTIGGVDLTAPSFLNGLVINSKWFGHKTLRYNSPIYSDNTQNKKVIQGLKFKEDLVPMNVSLVVNLFETFDEQN
jgi:hypothetical protein